MGNIGSTGGGNGRVRSRSRRSHPPPPLPQPPNPEITANRYVFAAATPHPPQFPNNNAPPPYYQYPSYYPAPPSAMPVPLPAPYDHHHRVDPAQANWVHRYPCGPMIHAPTPYVEHQKAVTIRNDVNIKKETLRIEPDQSDPGKFLVTFTFDAASAGRITVVFFAKEGEDCCLTPTKESLLPPVTLQFQQGLSQKFQQPSGTGMDLSMFSEAELSKEGEMDVYPLAVKAEALLEKPDGSSGDNSGPDVGSTISQITQVVFEKDKGEYRIKAVKQILWVNGIRYESQDIYGLVDRDFDGNYPGIECVICLLEPRDTAVLPCRHMFMCSGCAKVLRFQKNRFQKNRFQTNGCPICRQPVERLLEIKVSNGGEE